MDHVRIDPKFRRRPRPKRAGWAAREVFKFLLEVSAEFDLRGRFSPSMLDVEWLADEWANGDKEAHPECVALLTENLARLTAVGLTHRDGEDVVITDWDDFYKPSKPGAVRTAEYRDRLRHTTSPVTDVTTDVTRDGRDKSDATEQHYTTQHYTKGEEPPANGVSAPGGTPAPTAVVVGAQPDRRVTPTGEPGDLQNKLGRAWFDARSGAAFDWPMDEQRAVGAALGKAGGDETEVLRRWGNALEYTSFPVCGGVKDLVKHWNQYGTGPPKRANKDPHKAPIRAEEISKDKFENPGRVNDF